MDRCRCEEYAAAVEKLRFFTVGTLRPDIIDNYDRSGFIVTWIPHGVDYTDLKFENPKAHRIDKTHGSKENLLPQEIRKIQQMWCPYLKTIRKH